MGNIVIILHLSFISWLKKTSSLFQSPRSPNSLVLSLSLAIQVLLSPLSPPKSPIPRTLIMSSLFSFFFFLILLLPLLCYSHPTALNCTDPSRLCTSFLAFRNPNPNLPQILSMFDATVADVTSDPISNPNYLFIRKNCSCLASRRYFTNTTFTARQQGSAYSLVAEAYGALASLANSSRVVREGNVVGLRLYCGCSSGLWNYLMSYVMEEGDTVEGLASRFGVSMDSIETANGLDGPDGVVVGDVYYIPLNSGGFFLF